MSRNSDKPRQACRICLHAADGACTLRKKPIISSQDLCVNFRSQHQIMRPHESRMHYRKATVSPDVAFTGSVRITLNIY